MIENIKKHLIKRIFSNNALRYNKYISLDSYCTKYLGEVDINRLLVSNADTFKTVIDKMTIELVESFPSNNKFWGTSRHVLNTFMREIYMNTQLYNEYKLHRIEKYLESPLNMKILKYLSKSGIDSHMRRIEAIINITPQINDEIQSIVRKLADQKNIIPVLIEFTIEG